jgi:hypothetical protein
MKNEASVLLIAGAVMRSHITFAFAMNGATLKNCGRGSEDEVDVTFDVTVFEEVLSTIHEQRVLPTKETTVLKHGATRIDKQRHGLRAGAERVFKGQVLGAKIIGVDVSAESESRVTGLLRADAKRKHGPGCVIAPESEIALAGAHPDLFLVNARSYLNHDSLLIVVRNVIDGLLHCLEITRPICGHHDVPRSRASISRKKAQQAQKN